jgi:hypothetical protein
MVYDNGARLKRLTPLRVMFTANCLLPAARQFVL